MAWIITKYLLTAGIVILVSELAKRSDKLGGLVAALPLVTVVTLVWLYLENQSMEKSPTMLGTRSGTCFRPYRCLLLFHCCYLSSAFGRH